LRRPGGSRLALRQARPPKQSTESAPDDRGEHVPDEAAAHPQRSLLLRALDGRTDADPDLSMMTAQAGDRYLICSDGLPVAATDDQILQTLVSVPEPADAVLALIDLAIRGGAPDNVTVIVADVIDLERSDLPPTKKPVFAGAASAAVATPGRFPGHG